MERGNLPLEIVALVAEYLNLADLILLQRVSRQWHRVLSSFMVQSAAIRATVGGDIVVSDCKAAIQKRLRLERGKPYKQVSLPSPLDAEHNTFIHPGMLGYSNGILAWLEGETDLRSIAIFHLRTGKTDRLATENRDQLMELKISRSLIAVMSRRGYCHIWDIHTHEHQAFRLPSNDFSYFVVSDRKVAFDYREYIIHWAWDSAIARRIPIKTGILLLALHPSEDKFTVVRVGDKVYRGDRLVMVNDDDTCHVYTEKYTINNANEFHCSHSQNHQIPLIRGEIWQTQPAQEIYEGQTSTLLLKMGTADTQSKRYFSLQGDEVICHEMLPRPTISNAFCVGQDLIYAPVERLGATYSDRLAIMKSKGKRSASPANAMGECQHLAERHAIISSCIRVLGDSDFVIFADLRSLVIWGFDETWQPASWP
ncbi:hypothetical protein N7520_001782 [Penicillium odoratum]|uniref:uncharacterized protein n=1 Tax=Penicillium odoratum TaxID=1167516 RepID=UPI0025468447|nr:uncharacterized protein N7520_001782 [Penicillium odoratum]KAJ5778536.1 hypothetical protein N7520_001782 [Penicillium odoratum]